MEPNVGETTEEKTRALNAKRLEIAAIITAGSFAYRGFLGDPREKMISEMLRVADELIRMSGWKP